MKSAPSASPMLRVAVVLLCVAVSGIAASDSDTGVVVAPQTKAIVEEFDGDSAGSKAERGPWVTCSPETCFFGGSGHNCDNAAWLSPEYLKDSATHEAKNPAFRQGLTTRAVVTQHRLSAPKPPTPYKGIEKRAGFKDAKRCFVKAGTLNALGDIAKQYMKDHPEEVQLRLNAPARRVTGRGYLIADARSSLVSDFTRGLSEVFDEERRYESLCLCSSLGASDFEIQLMVPSEDKVCFKTDVRSGRGRCKLMRAVYGCFALTSEGMEPLNAEETAELVKPSPRGDDQKADLFVTSCSSE